MKLAHDLAWTGALAAIALASASATAAPRAKPTVGEICHGVPEAETHLAVLLSKADVLWVDELKDGVRLTDGTRAAGGGARIVISARPYTTADWLQRVIDCHLARNAAGSNTVAASTSPLDVPGAAARVSAQPGYLIVDVTSKNEGSASLILSRARAVSPPVQVGEAQPAQPRS